MKRRLTERTIKKYNSHHFCDKQLEIILKSQIEQIDENTDFTLSFNLVKSFFRIKSRCNKMPTDKFFNGARCYILHGNFIYKILSENSYEFQRYRIFAVPLVQIF